MTFANHGALIGEAPDVANATIEIGGFRLDAAAGTLSREGAVVPVRAKTFAFLTYLARHHGRVVPRDELLEALWPGLHVTEDSLTQCMSELRRLMGPEAQPMLRTVPKRGYLLAPDPVAPAGAGQVFPAVAVLPSADAGSGEADRALIDGMVEEITYGLARFRSIVVIARASAFAFPPGDRPSPGEVGARLGAEFLVEGSVSRADGRFRVTVTLLHAPTGRRIWGDRFDIAEQDLFAMNVEIAISIISRLVSNIDQAVLRNPAPAANLAAFENFVRGLAFLRGYGEGINARARDHFRRAIEIDPDCALAHAYLGLSEVIIADYGCAPRAVLEAARERIALAIALEPEEARCHRLLGLVQLYLREHEAAERALRHSLQLNPYDADTLCQLGFVVAMRGRAEEGLAWMDKAVALNPFRPYWYDSDRAEALYMLERYDEAIPILLAAPRQELFLEIWLAAALAMVDDLPRAAEVFGRFRRDMPEADIDRRCRDWTEFEHGRDAERFIEGVRRAERAWLRRPG